MSIDTVVQLARIGRSWDAERRPSVEGMRPFIEGGRRLFIEELFIDPPIAFGYVR